MSANVEIFALPQVANGEPIAGFGLRLQGDKLWNLKVRSWDRGGEPLAQTYKARVAFRSSKATIESPATLVLTRLRVIALLPAGADSKGLDRRRAELGLISIERSELEPPRRVNKALGQLKCIELVDKSGTCRIAVFGLKEPDRFLEALTTEYAEEFLGEERANEMQRARQEEAERKARAEHEKQQKIRQANTERFPTNAPDWVAVEPPRSMLPGGLMDHRKTWRYKVRATPGQCAEAFGRAFTGTGGLLLKARWAVAETGNGATATYNGRKGVGAIGTTLSRTMQDEESAAIGSIVKFEVEEEGDGYVICAMWLAARATTFGFTNDGRFFRPYMRAVESELRSVDPSLQVAKD